MDLQHKAKMKDYLHSVPKQVYIEGSVLLRLSASPQYRVHWQQAFWPAAERERAAAHERAHQNAEFIVHVAAQKEADPSRGLAADGHVSALSL